MRARRGWLIASQIQKEGEGRCSAFHAARIILRGCNFVSIAGAIDDGSRPTHKRFAIARGDTNSAHSASQQILGNVNLLVNFCFG